MTSPMPLRRSRAAIYVESGLVLFMLSALLFLIALFAYKAWGVMIEHFAGTDGLERRIEALESARGVE